MSSISAPTVMFRVDASAAIGAGHASRCAALSGALAAQGARVLLATRSLPSSIRGWFPEAAEVVLLSDDEDACVAELARERKASFAIVDGYHIERTLAEQLRRFCAVVVVDDRVEALGWPCDALINHNLYAMDWEPFPGTLGLMGPAFALIRDDILEKSRTARARGHADRVLISLGAGNTSSFASGVLAGIEARCCSLDVRVIHGTMAAESDPLASAAAGCFRNRVEVVRHASSLGSHLLWCDVLIASAGTLVLEACAVGAPLVLVALAQNQRPVASAAERLGLAVVPPLDQNSPESVVTELQRLLSDPAARDGLLENQRNVVGRDGSRRTAALLLNHFGRVPAGSPDAEACACERY